MNTIDLNADIGEADNPDWAASEAAIVKAISSANIACGGHAGDAASMRLTVRNAKTEGVTIGAHPAYPDRENFGRTSLVLGEDIEAKVLSETLRTQILDLAEICASENTTLAYVKPHGALYNDSVFDAEKADLIARVIADLNMGLTFLGGPNSQMKPALLPQRERFKRPPAKRSFCGQAHSVFTAIAPAPSRPHIKPAPPLRQKASSLRPLLKS